MKEKLIADIILAFPKYKEKLPVLEHMNVEGLQGILDIEAHCIEQQINDQLALA
ncbi:hypothetical protein N0K73_05290 [Dellaglioa algida]|uniref:hypothetical protein n=1 Tax=Dellaglioa algida TaxID=105612 RepID=UPI0024C48BDB|nr:hypothetical protein [Dellaglioa algida]MDK1718687.1 hypothetical protein [Dellaglioa algida]